MLDPTSRSILSVFARQDGSYITREKAFARASVSRIEFDYHWDDLKEKGYIKYAAGNIRGHRYYALTQIGRKYVDGQFSD
jgi:DNA-binding PadR family transcriptional regulator